ncbi:MAG: hypothetical protein HKP61_00930 [Dactylosporangium sp.]|nr:hypothetical protein [Dactylosporangium sp.]NNJ59534.1 hypothetical protein [Dactylosporangium sp.]
MALIATIYCKGTGGSTTTALALAAIAPPAWRPVLVECDPAGGDLMRRHRLASAPSLVDLAAASRGPRQASGGIEVFNAVERQLWLRHHPVDLVVAPPSGAQTKAALGELTRPGNTTLTAAARLILADCGRWEPGSPVRPLLAAANAVLVLVRARVEDLAHLHEHLAELLGLVSGRLIVLLAPGGVYPLSEVASAIAGYLVRELAADPAAVRVAGPLPSDRRAAGILAGDLLPGRRWRRLPLLVALSRLLDDLAPALTRPVSAVAADREVTR